MRNNRKLESKVDTLTNAAEPSVPHRQAEVEALVRRARQACVLLNENLPRADHDVRALNVWSKAPFQLLCVRETLYWRVEELARGACDGLERDDLAAAALLARGVIESVGLAWQLLELLQERNKHSAKTLNDLLMRAFSGSRRWEEMPKPYHVMDLVRLVDKLVPGYLASYEALSEIAHPNGLGVFGLFGTIDKERYVVHFGRNREKTYSTRGLIAEALLGAIGLFEPAYNRMADELPKFLDELGNIWPEKTEKR